MAASYEYSPFGESLRANGAMADQNPFRFSTQYTDKETGCNYVKSRYYSVMKGEWLSRDVIEEQGGENIYAYVDNNPVSSVDPFGFQELPFFGTIDVGLVDQFTVPAPYAFTADISCQAGKLVVNQSPEFTIPQHLYKDWSVDITDLGKLGKTIAKKLEPYKEIIALGPQAKMNGSQNATVSPVIEKLRTAHKNGCCWRISYKVTMDVSAHLKLFWWKATLFGLFKTQNQASVSHFENSGTGLTKSYEFCCGGN